MIHIFIWREWNTFALPPGSPSGHWEHWKTLPVEYRDYHMKYLRGLGLEVEYVGF